MRLSNALSVAALIVILFAVSVFSQQTDRDLYEQNYRTGRYDESRSIARQAAKKNPSDWHAHYYVGLSSLKLDKEKDAVKAFEKAVAINPTEASARTALAYAYMLRNDTRASNEAREALKLNKRNAEANYVLAVIAIRTQAYNVAYERSKAAIAINPQSAPAYLVKTQALVSSFVKQRGTVVTPENSRGSLLAEAAEDLEKYLSLAPSSPGNQFHKGNLESIRFFSEYYSHRPVKIELDEPQVPLPTDSNKTPLRIVSKQKAQYTDRARQAGIEGTITLLVGFSADATIKHIMVLKSLGYGLDEEAVRAVKAMKFVPETEDGKPVSTVRPVSFTFDIY